jgi:hypothetical protein
LKRRKKERKKEREREKQVTMKSILAWTLFLQQSTATIAFHLFPTSTRLSLLTRYVSSDFEGIIGEYNGDEGRTLAREFEQELKARRERVEKEKESLSQSNRRLLSQDELRLINQRAFSNRRRRQVVAGKDVMPTTSAGFFTGRGQSVYSFPLDNPRAAQSQRDEYSLANNNNTPVLPILVALALLSIYMAVGLTGDVSETMHFGGDAVNENVERVVPSVEGSALEPVVPSVYL